MKNTILITLILLLFTTMAVAKNKTDIQSTHQIKVSTYAKGLNQPWGMTFLPDGQLLVTEKKGNFRLISLDGRVSDPLTGMIDITIKGQGGLMDVVLDPDFDNNQMIYFSYVKLTDKTDARTAVAKAQFANNSIKGIKTIWQQAQASSTGRHFGSRLVFDRTGHLFVTLGDRGGRDNVQDMSNHFGKVVRIDTDGQPAKDNPFLNQKNALPDIYSTGHRNVQGAFLHPETGELWGNEHGPRGGDEINLIQAGKNYGWPLITYGINYIGTSITDKTEMEGMEQPIHYWDPSIATSGMLIYSGDVFPNWKGNIFTGALKLMHLNRIQLDENNKVVTEERLLKDQQSRIRAIEQGPNGYIYVATDSAEGKILRISPLLIE